MAPCPHQGRSVHSATVADFATATVDPLDPVNAQTRSESTTRFDNLGRVVARTQWLVARGAIDPANPPIAGLDGVPVADGLTTQTFYDSNLKDDVGFDNSTGMTIPKLGGGTYQLSLSSVIDQLAQAESLGWPAINFSRTAPGSAVVSIGPDQTIHASISDSAGRTVFQGQLQPWNGPQPFALVTRSCQRYDLVANISGFGDVIETRTVDPLGKTTRSRTDGSGRTLESYDQESRLTAMTHDAAGNVITMRDPNGVGYDAVYDELGRMTSQTDTWGDTTAMSYDKEGNVRTQTDAKGKVTTIVYDARNRRKSVTDRLAGVTTFNWHPAGHLASLVDAEGQTTSYTHNIRGEKIAETYPDHVPGSAVGTPGYGIVEFAYDAAGRLLRKTDQTGATVTMNYDLAGRVPQRDYRTAANSPSGTIADSDVFIFDAASRMASAVSGRYSNTVGMTYDFAGRLATESLTIAGQTYTVTREYDSLNRIKKYIYPDSTQVERTYTDRGQLHQLKYNSAVIDTRTYDLGGRLSTGTYSNGAVTTHSYRSSGAQKDNLLASIATTNPGADKVGTYAYTWDANKNKTAETITGSPLSTHGFSTGATGYDDENRVTAWNRSDNNQSQAWSLSLVGDWNTFNQAGTSAFSQTRTHGPTHEFLSFTNTLPTPPVSETLTYNVKGNLTHRPASLLPHPSPLTPLNLTWDFDNRLIGADTNATPASLEVTYQYDALGRRVARTESGSTVIYFQAGQQTLLDYASGAAPTSPTYRYVYASYIDEPVLRVTAKGSVHHFFHRNQQYSITALTDSSGNTAERYAYTAYGALTVFDATGSPLISSSLNSRYTYTGREWDPTLSKYYFRARWFDPAAGRFTGRDPLGFLDGPSLYNGYFSLLSIDPDGTVVCNGKPEGAEFVQRGVFAGTTLADYNNGDDFKYGGVWSIGSHASISWRPNNAQEFLSDDGCGCCCEKVGLVQIVEERYEYAWFGETHSGPRLDGGFPYKTKDTTFSRPCDPSPPAAISDMPNFQLISGGFLNPGNNFLKGWQTFETCAVCLSGKEGPVGKLQAPLGTSMHGPIAIEQTSITGLTIYGCVTWGHRISHSRGFVYHVHRWLDDDFRTGFTKATQSRGAETYETTIGMMTRPVGPGKVHSSKFLEAVNGHLAK